MTPSNKPLNSNDPYNRHGTRHETQKENSAGKTVGIAFAAVAIAAVAAAGLYLIDVDQTQEARLPNVDKVPTLNIERPETDDPANNPTN
jgi:hypothetical protein